MNIYFPNVGRRCELIRCFQQTLANISPGAVWGSDPDHTAPALQIVDKVVALPRDFNSNIFAEKLIDFLKREKIDLIIPTIDPDLARLSCLRSRIQTEVPEILILLSSPKVVTVASNKVESREFCASLGYETPVPVVNPTAADLPLFVKPAFGSASEGAQAVFSLAQLQDAASRIDFPVVEKIVEGDEVTVDVLLDLNGSTICVSPRRRVKVRGGEVVKANIFRDDGLEALASSIAESFGCIGPVTLQFRNPRPKSWVFMEINPRMGGGLPLTISAGADWPGAIVKMALGEDRERINCNLKSDSLVMSRYDQSFFMEPTGSKSALSVPSSLPKLVIFDMDDTLFAERQFVRSGYRAVAEVVWNDFGVEIESDLNSKFDSGLRGDLFSSVLLERGVQFSERYIAQRLVPAYRNHEPLLTPFLDVLPFLQKLIEKNHLVALISDGEQSVQRNKFHALGVADYFNEVFFTDQLGREHWKPSTKSFIEVCNKLGVVNSEAIYLADNPRKDFVAPNMLGMQSIRVRRKGLENTGLEPLAKREMPTYEINSFVDLIAVNGA